MYNDGFVGIVLLPSSADDCPVDRASVRNRGESLDGVFGEMEKHLTGDWNGNA